MHIKSSTGRQGWILWRHAGHEWQIWAKKHASCRLASSTVAYICKNKRHQEDHQNSWEGWGISPKQASWSVAYEICRTGQQDVLLFVKETWLLVNLLLHTAKDFPWSLWETGKLRLLQSIKRLAGEKKKKKINLFITEVKYKLLSQR